KDDPDAFNANTKVLGNLVQNIVPLVRGADHFHYQVRYHLPGLSMWHRTLSRPALVRHKSHIRAAFPFHYRREIKQQLLHDPAQLMLSDKVREISCQYCREPYFMCTHWA